MWYYYKDDQATAFHEAVDKAVRFLAPLQIKTVVFRGFSGAVVGSAVAYALKCGVVVVRKQVGEAHSSRKVEGKITGRYVVIDDFIDSGNTIQHIIADLKTSGLSEGKQCVGLYLYEDRWLDANDPHKTRTPQGAEYAKEQRERFAQDAGMRILNWVDKQELLDELKSDDIPY